MFRLWNGLGLKKEGGKSPSASKFLLSWCSGASWKPFQHFTVQNFSLNTIKCICLYCVLCSVWISQSKIERRLRGRKGGKVLMERYWMTRKDQVHPCFFFFLTSAGSDFFCLWPHMDDIISVVKQASVQNRGQSCRHSYLQAFRTVVRTSNIQYWQLGSINCAVMWCTVSQIKMSLKTVQFIIQEPKQFIHEVLCIKIFLVRVCWSLSQLS